MSKNLEKVKTIHALNIKALRGMLKILKPIKADEATAVRMMLSQIMQNELDASKLLEQEKPKTKPIVDWEAVTEDIE